MNVLAAIAIRGMQNAGRSLNYGYAWSFLQPILYICVFRLGQLFTGLNPTAMANMTFLICGVMPVMMFLNGMTRGLKSTHRGMSVIPRITQLDSFIASGFLLLTQFELLFWGFIIPVSIVESAWPPENALGVQATLIADWLCALSLAYLLAGLTRWFPPMGEFRRFLVRPLRWISGMFFVITAVPTWVWPYLTWNPVLHVTELMRSYWFTTYTTPIGSLPYVLEWTAVSLLIGLSLDRWTRRALYE